MMPECWFFFGMYCDDIWGKLLALNYMQKWLIRNVSVRFCPFACHGTCFHLWILQEREKTLACQFKAVSHVHILMIMLKIKDLFVDVCVYVTHHWMHSTYTFPVGASPCVLHGDCNYTVFTVILHPWRGCVEGVGRVGGEERESEKMQGKVRHLMSSSFSTQVIPPHTNRHVDKNVKW